MDPLATATGACARCGAALEQGDLRCAICGLAAPGQTAAPEELRARVVRCGSCGAAVSYSAEVQAAKCAFCASVVQVETQEDPSEQAEAYLPFTVDPNGARRALADWLRGQGFFRPRDLATDARVETLRPLWWPAWIFDATALVSWAADSDAGSGQAAWAPHAGQTEMSFTRILVPASRGLTHGECAGLAAHFDLGSTAPQPRGPAGGLVERFEAQRSAARLLVVQAAEAVAAERLRGAVIPGRKFRNLHVQALLRSLVTRCYALPTYVLAYRYRGRLYRVLVHGQAAHCTFGQAPLSLAKVAIVLVAGALAILGLLKLVAWFLG